MATERPASVTAVVGVTTPPDPRVTAVASVSGPTVYGGAHNCFREPVATPRIVLTSEDNNVHPLELLAGATVWEDMRISGLAIKLGANAPDWVSVGASGNLNAYGFTGSGVTVEEAHFTMQMSHTYKLGTNIDPHIHWMPSTTNSGNVVWQMEYMFADVDDTYPAPSTIVSDPDDAGGTAWVHKIASMPEISGADEVSAVLIGRIFRDPAHASDTYADDAILISIDFHFQIDTLGSRQKVIK